MARLLFQRRGRPGSSMFILDVYAQRIVAWHALTSERADLVMIPLRMAMWQRAREGRPTAAGELIHHSDRCCQWHTR